MIPPLPKDTTDRNRTSPFAFTGNKFEFRAVGSSANPALPITVINCIVAESLNEVLDAIESAVARGGEWLPSVFTVLKESIKKSKSIRFAGDNYSVEWQKEAAKRDCRSYLNLWMPLEYGKALPLERFLKGY